MTIFISILALLIALGTAFILVTLVYYAVFYVPYVPTPQKVVDQMVAAAGLQDGQVVVDMGSGDGRLLLTAAKSKKVKAIGYEACWLIILLAKVRLFFSHQKVTFSCQNFYRADLKEADVIFCYLFPKVMEKLKVKFEQELKPGATIISYSFPMKGWTPIRTLQTRDDKPQNFLIYVYKIPSKTHED